MSFDVTKGESDRRGQGGFSWAVLIPKEGLWSSLHFSLFQDCLQMFVIESKYEN